MANEEIKTFNVFNKSVRLVHIGGVMVPPETVVAVVDDTLGINRLDVENSEYLELTDDEPTVAGGYVAPKVKPTAKATSATGASWSAKK